VIVTVLTPPPGYHELRRFQNQLAGLGYPNALALPPLLVLESDELPHYIPKVGLRWVKTRNGMGLGFQNEAPPYTEMGALFPSNSWLLMAWDWTVPTIPIPELHLPSRKYRLAQLEIEKINLGLRWRWLSQTPYLLPEGL